MLDWMKFWKKKEPVEDTPNVEGGGSFTINTNDLMLIQEYIRDGKKVNAIQHCRATTGLGLKKSKVIVDALCAAEECCDAS